MATCPNKNTQEWKDLVKSVGENKAYFLWDYEEGNRDYLISYQLPNTEGQIASEKTIRDLAARISDRIGVPYRIISDRTKEFKGKIENGIAIINLAYATLDTPIHEILGHPIIRAIKSKQNVTKRQQWNFNKPFFNDQTTKNNTGKTITHEGHIYEVYELKKFSNTTYKAINFKRNEEIELSEKEFNDIVNQSQLYQNLLKELEYGKGKEVLDRIKRDYVDKYSGGIIKEIFGNYLVTDKSGVAISDNFKTKQEAIDYALKLKNNNKYTLEEQQEEAIVELLGLMTAEKLNAVKDGKLISLLKRLLKEIKEFVRNLLNQKEVEIDSLPDNLALNDLANLLAYSNSKLILPGYEVQYTTPDNNKFKTYQEASNHISELAKNVKDVDLNNINVNTEDTVNVKDLNLNTKQKVIDFAKRDANYIIDFESLNIEQTPIGIRNLIIKNAKVKNLDFYGNPLETFNIQDVSMMIYDNSYEQLGLQRNYLKDFIEKNKEYEQSKEVIEEWKKVNNIQYNPEEIYSRGQEFSSVVGAYSSFDVNLMMQNLLSHIEDNEKAGGKFAISAYTKPIDKQIGHLEGGGGKIKFKLYPQSNDILWAANTDVYSGSVWDASEKVNKDKKSELLGVSYTKYPSLENVKNVQPNLAAVIDDLRHHHNELGIVITGNNFRLEYDENIPYSTKKIIDATNKILDQKYGKLVKPEIKKEINKKEFAVFDSGDRNPLNKERFKTLEEAQKWVDKHYSDAVEHGLEIYAAQIEEIGIQPTQTNETLKESINSIKNNLEIVQDAQNKYERELKNYNLAKQGILPEFWNIYSDFNGILDKKISIFTHKDQAAIWQNKEYDEKLKPFIKEESQNQHGVKFWILKDKFTQDALDSFKEPKKPNNKEYTNQALINTKIAALKEVAKKYPRSLIRSEVKIKPTNTFYTEESMDFLGFEPDELPFQKIPSNVNALVSTGRTSFTTKEALSILKDQANSKSMKVLAEHLMNNIVNDAPIEILDYADLQDLSIALGINYEVGGLYDPDINKIFISDVSRDASVLHEIIHAFTWKKLKTPTIPGVQDLKNLYEHVKIVHSELKEEYAMSSLDEFITGIFTNSEFMYKLQKLPSRGTGKLTLWDNFINALSKLFGISKENRSLLTEAMDAGIRILSNTSRPAPVKEKSSIFASAMSKLEMMDDKMEAYRQQEITKKKMSKAKKTQKAVNEVSKESPKNTLNEAKKFAVQEFDRIFPQYKYMSLEEKKQLMDWTFEGDLNLNCKI